MNAELNEFIPRHVAIIMDGNGRWAKKRGVPRIKGHQRGAEVVRTIMQACKKAGVEYLTLYAFSTENWQRPKAEIAGLTKLLVKFLRTYESDMHKEKIRLRTIGQLTDFPPQVQAVVKRIIKATENYTRAQLILALSYGARAEITNAARAIAKRVKNNEVKLDDINEALVAAHLYAPDIPEPDLLIRTSGEMRLSNFLLWQLSYTELYITDVLWPDFTEADFFRALSNYARRQRRFGNINQAKKG